MFFFNLSPVTHPKGLSLFGIYDMVGAPAPQFYAEAATISPRDRSMEMIAAISPNYLASPACRVSPVLRHRKQLSRNDHVSGE
jgi:hypothetical protein